jgi:DNA gyrase subunit A
MVINKSGITIRIGVDTLRIMGRATQGVKIIRLREGDTIASVAKVSKSKDDEIDDNADSLTEDRDTDSSHDEIENNDNLEKSENDEN